MASEVDIVNLALSHIGDEATVTAISPPDGSAQAAHGRRFYPIARGVLLEAFPWPFATRRTELAQVDNDLSEDWSYAYALPSTCIRPLAALSPGVPAKSFSLDSDVDSFPYAVEAAADGSLVLYTNLEAATLRYIDLVTDASKFTPGFVVALSRLLASYLAGPILKGDKGAQVAQQQYAIFTREFASACAKAANVGKRDGYETRVPSFLAARGLNPRTTQWQ